jgi:hypothetical protein
MRHPYVEIARGLVEASEARLSDPAEPETLDLAIACARTNYEIGSRYLHALQERARAIRMHSIVGAMRWTVRVCDVRDQLLADACREPARAA